MMPGISGLFKAKKVQPWSLQRGYKGGHRSGVPKRGSQHRKHTLRGALFGRGGATRGNWLWN